MALRNYMYSKHNQDNNINTLIFHKGAQTSNAESAARDKSIQKKDTQTTESINDEERSKTLVSNAEDTKVPPIATNDEDLRNNSINTLYSTSDTVHNAEASTSTNAPESIA